MYSSTVVIYMPLFCFFLNHLQCCKYIRFKVIQNHFALIKASIILFLSPIIKLALNKFHTIIHPYYLRHNAHTFYFAQLSKAGIRAGIKKLNYFTPYCSIFISGWYRMPAMQ
jgi:hypothetical protein